MTKTVHRRQVLSAFGAVLVVAPAISFPVRASDVSPLYKDFSGVWLVDARRGPAGRRGPGGPGRPDDRRGPPDRFGPPGGDDASIPGLDIPGLDRGDRHTYSIMTEEGRKAFASMKPEDLPANNCQSPGLPSIVMTPNLQIWSVTGDTLTIHHEYYDTVRAIHLDRRTHPDDAVHTPSGDAVSWIDGDTLVIETTDLTAMPGGLGRNAPGSDARTVVERYRLSPDKQMLNGDLTISDPKYLTRPIMIRARMTRQPAGTEIPSIPCSIDSARAYLKKE